MPLQALASLERHRWRNQDPVFAVLPTAPAFTGEAPPIPPAPIEYVTLSSTGAAPTGW